MPQPQPTNPLGRMNMTQRQREVWRPPTFRRPDGAVARLAAVARRALDLQAASIWNDLCRLLPPLRGRVLDVGCGAQPYRCLFHAGVTYRGIDHCDAKANFGYEIPDTTYYTGDIWPVDDGQFDAVLCTETLEHVLNVPQFLGQAARCLRPGGVLILTVPFAARWHYIPHDYWRFTPSSLAHLLEQAGFGDVCVYARGNRLTVACYKLMALLLPLMWPQQSGLLIKLLKMLVALWFLPVLVVAAAVAHLSLRCEGGDDCLGYTVLASRNPPEPPAQ